MTAETKKITKQNHGTKIKPELKFEVPKISLHEDIFLKMHRDCVLQFLKVEVVSFDDSAITISQLWVWQTKFPIFEFQKLLTAIFFAIK